MSTSRSTSPSPNTGPLSAPSSIDWLRNQRGSTAVVPYSPLACAKMPVSAPVTWEELRKIDSPARFTIRDAAELNDRAASPSLAGWGMADQILPDA